MTSEVMSEMPTSPAYGQLLSAIARLFPGYFAFVMATGVVAIAAKQQKITVVANGLYVVAVVGYVALSVLTIARLVVFRDRLYADLTSHAKGFAFLTIVAATNVLGSASGLIRGWWGLARGLWWVSVVCWVVLVYATLIAVVLRHNKPELGKGINGTWFLLTVSSQSVAVLGALLLTRAADDLLAFGCIAAFLLGVVLYLIVMTMVFLRWTFQPLEPTDAEPPAWIAAGAVAITVLAGSNLLAARSVSPRIDRLATFIEGLVMLAWATATFWFPLMVAIGVWRHVVHRVPLRYHPSYWALVFPLGMYGAATFKMCAAIKLAPLGWVPQLTLIVALTAWAIVFGALVYSSIALRLR
jgi:tellurite resistance protein TehA-like permease